MLSVNGTIKHVNLNQFGGGLKSRILHDHASLICIYDETFGHNKAPVHDYRSPAAALSQQQIRPLSKPSGAALGRPMSQGQAPPMKLSKKQKERLYSSGNPLKMIKELKYQKAAKGNNDSKSGGIGSIDFISNASTKEFHAEEKQRAYKIMNDPLESLVFGPGTTQHGFNSRPVSREFGKASRSTRRGNLNIINSIASRKERAMTAGAGHNKRHGVSRSLARA